MGNLCIPWASTHRHHASYQTRNPCIRRAWLGLMQATKHTLRLGLEVDCYGWLKYVVSAWVGVGWVNRNDRLEWLCFHRSKPMGSQTARSTGTQHMPDARIVVDHQHHLAMELVGRPIVLDDGHGLGSRVHRVLLTRLGPSCYGGNCNDDAMVPTQTKIESRGQTLAEDGERNNNLFI
jgi:hypothetical protein